MKKIKINKEVLFVIIVACLIRIYKLPELMPFYGDIGRDFLVAKNIITENKFPLLGPPTSLDWLNLGPMVYYLWALAFFIGGFHPVSIGYLVILFDIGTIVLLYKIGTNFLGKQKGILAAFLYALSPLAIFHSRIPLHTNISPFFSTLTIFLFAFWLRTRKEKFLYLSFFSAGLMLQSHLATGIIVLYLLFYLILKERNFEKLLKSLFFFAIPLIPLLLADFVQKKFMMAKFLVWIPYRALSFFGVFTARNMFTLERGFKTIQVLLGSIQKAIFLPNQYLSLFLLLISLIYFYKLAKKNEIARFILILVLFSGLAFFIHGEPQEHYLVFLAPLFAIFLSNFLRDLLRKQLILAVFILVLIPSINLISLIKFHYYVNDGIVTPKFNYGIPLGQQIEIMKFIIKDSGGRNYQIVNPPDMMALTTLYENYRYLGWWLGKEESINGVLKYRIYGRKHAILPLKEGEKIIEFPSTYVVRMTN